MKTICVPTSSSEDWRQFLAQPDKHWREGYSAKSLADAWEDSNPHLPPEITSCFDKSNDHRLTGLELLLAIPEHKVDLPPVGGRPSQTDLFALCRNESGTVCIAVEGKVDEPLGPTVSEHLKDASVGLLERVAFLKDKLKLPENICGDVRYQLLHRTASAHLIAERFHAQTAVMLVHSFSQESRWLEDLQVLAGLYGKEVSVGEVVCVGVFDGVTLFVGWAKGK